jgi:hypothetical protein
MTQADIIGTLGVGLILIAYFCNVAGKLSSSDKRFILLNLFGSALACYASYIIRYWPFVILEGTWFLVSVLDYLLQKR